jgi:hypothetical protein
MALAKEVAALWEITCISIPMAQLFPDKLFGKPHTDAYSCPVSSLGPAGGLSAVVPFSTEDKHILRSQASNNFISLVFCLLSAMGSTNFISTWRSAVSRQGPPEHLRNALDKGKLGVDKVTL